MMNWIIEILRKKWMLIITIGILFSFIFMGLKYMAKDSYTLAPSDDVLISEIIKIDNYSDRYDGLKYDRYLNSPAFLYSFYESTKNIFEYDKLSPGWNNKTDSQKIKWMATHIQTEYYGAGRIAVTLNLKKSDPMNLGYVKKYGEAYIKSWFVVK